MDPSRPSENWWAIWRKVASMARWRNNFARHPSYGWLCRRCPNLRPIAYVVAHVPSLNKIFFRRILHELWLFQAQRAVAYNKASTDIDKWNDIIHKNRLVNFSIFIVHHVTLVGPTKWTWQFGVQALLNLHLLWRIFLLLNVWFVPRPIKSFTRWSGPV